MQKTNTVSMESNIKEKIKYLGLNFRKVPKTLIATDNLGFKTFKGYDEKQYKQYRFINVSDIDIMITPTHRLDSLSERYEKASPLYMYLNSKDSENEEKYETFLKMLKKVEISEIEKIENEQKMLEEKIPYRVKFNGNYLWQIYYSENLDSYFMLVPTEDSDYSTFFYLLMKKIENKKNEMIFAPISYLDYSEEILKKSEIKDLENYLWLFTKDYPAIYEVYDKNEKCTLQIVGETNVYDKIKSLYKVSFEARKEASKFYKLVKALFLLQTELPHYYSFTTKIKDNGEIELYLDEKKIEYEKLPEFVHEQYVKSKKIEKITEQEIIDLKAKLEQLKIDSIKLERDYVEKEKIISTFLECKKTFLGKMKYFFTMGKKSKKFNKKAIEKENERVKEKRVKENNTKTLPKYEEQEKKNYTLDELIMSYKELEILENRKKDVAQDINAIKLKNKNLKRKIQNATAYILEINKHKRSIFEFWKYSNKDSVATLDEGEEEEINISNIERTFNYEEDFEAFGERVDKNQRLKFTDSELDGCFLATTELFDVIRDIHNKKNVELIEFSNILKMLKEEKNEDMDLDEFDVLGNYGNQANKERKLGNKMHREVHRNKNKILEIKKGMKGVELKKNLYELVKNIGKALKKNTLEEDIYVYKALKDNVELKGLMTFSLNVENEIKDYISKNNTENYMYLYRLKLHKNTNFVAFTNIILYDNKNMTLPVGMQESDKILVDLNEMKIKVGNVKQVKIQYLEESKNDFSNVINRKINICEFDT